MSIPDTCAAPAGEPVLASGWWTSLGDHEGKACLIGFTVSRCSRAPVGALSLERQDDNLSRRELWLGGLLRRPCVTIVNAARSLAAELHEIFRPCGEQRSVSPPG